MADPPTEFETLLRQARGGDAAAQARLVAQYEPKVRIVARVLLGPALRPYLDSIDLVQSVHRSLLVGLRDEKLDVSTPDRLLGLAVVMVRRKVARHWRRMRRQTRLEAWNEDLCEVLTSLATPQADPARAAALADQLRHLCDRLNPSERRMIELRMQDYSNDEIARQMSLQPVALRVRLSRLRQRLEDAGVLSEWL